MTVRPIIFSAEMVRALTYGIKTQTRRLASSPLRRVEVGDLLYVREAWRVKGAEDWQTLAQSTLYCTSPDDVVHRATADPLDVDFYKFRPSIHMPRWASRLTLKVTEVRFQGLLEIGAKDASVEGLAFYDGVIDVVGQPRGPREVYGERYFVSQKACEDWESPYEYAEDAFAALWGSLHDKPGERWEDNPEVVALTFEVIHKNVDNLGGEA